MHRHAHALAVPAVAAAAIAEHAVVRPDEPLRAVVLLPRAALIAGRRQLAAGALRPNSCDALDDLVLDAHGVFSGRPPGAQRVDVAAADAAVRDADVDVGCGEM